MNKKIDFDYYANYFAMLEDRLFNTERYVACEQDNLKTYSLEFVSIINECGGLINGFCVELCNLEEHKKDEYDIRDYKNYIIKHYNQYIENIVYCGRFTLMPWQRLKSETGNSPKWWGIYNSIKHGGSAQFKEANLENTISCMAGMFSLLCMYDIERFGTRMSNLRGFFRFGGNYNKVVSWEC